MDPANEEHGKLLLRALRKKVSADRDGENFFPFEIHPYDYQKEILEKLDAQRVLHGLHRNLVVAATGVGKTVVSAFDFKRFAQNHPNAELLFVAHREEILKQSRDTFHYTLKNMNFGEPQVGSHQAQSLEHLFIKYTENTPASKLPYSRSESEGRG